MNVEIGLSQLRFVGTSLDHIEVTFVAVRTLADTDDPLRLQLRDYYRTTTK